MTENEQPSEESSDRFRPAVSYVEGRDGAELVFALAGKLLENLEKLGEKTGVSATVRDRRIRLESSDRDALKRAEGILVHLIGLARERNEVLRDSDLDTAIGMFDSATGGAELRNLYSCRIRLPKRRQEIVPRSVNQRRYLEALGRSDLVFALGPAGTGKTYLAVAMAVNALMTGKRERIILARPAVEAGESLGFLPGKLEDKINPYLRPLHDALREMIEPAELAGMFEKGLIELAPLAFMRGRTLNHSFIILDEAQNATDDQMLMFLTRMGFDSQCVVAGDPSQTDLPSPGRSGLPRAVRKLSGIDGVEVCRFDRGDVMRHSLVEKIVQAYESHRDPEPVSEEAQKA